MASAVKGSTTGMLIIGKPNAPLSNAFEGCLTKSSPGIGRPASRLSAIVTGLEQEVLGAEDFTIGNPTSTSLRMDAAGKWRFRWALMSGPHSIQINVLQAVNLNPRPSLAVMSNPAIGLNSLNGSQTCYEAFAPNSTDWTVIGPITFNTTGAGATWVELRCNLSTHVGSAPCYWCHVVKS